MNIDFVPEFTEAELRERVAQSVTSTSIITAIEDDLMLWIANPDHLAFIGFDEGTEDTTVS